MDIGLNSDVVKKHTYLQRFVGKSPDGYIPKHRFRHESGPEGWPQVLKAPTRVRRS